MNNEEVQRYNAFVEIHTEFILRHCRGTINQQTLDTPRGNWFRWHRPPAKKGSKILDLGGSFGYYGAYVRLVCQDDFEYHLVDKKKRWIRLAPIYFEHMNAGEVILHEADLNDFFPLDERFDQIWLIGAPHTIKSYGRLFDSIREHLAPGGVMVTELHTVRVKEDLE